jgi:ABC-2 type transport system permease protein
VAALLRAFGVGLGALIRNQVIAIVGVLLWAFAIEPALVAFVPDAARFGPIDPLPTAITGIDPESAGLGDITLIAPGLALLAMLAWIGAAFASGATLLRRRDLH